MAKKIKASFYGEISGILFDDNSMKFDSLIIQDDERKEKKCVLNPEQVLGVKKFIEFLTSDFN